MSATGCQRLCDGFSHFFANKISTIKDAISTRLLNATGSTDALQFDVRHSGLPLINLIPPTVNEVNKLIRSMPAKVSVQDCFPVSIIKSSPDLFAPLIACLAALSFSQGVFPSKFKTASVTPLLKRPEWIVMFCQVSTYIQFTHNLEDYRADLDVKNRPSCRTVA